jgi:hypothetical protein
MLVFLVVKAQKNVFSSAPNCQIQLWYLIVKAPMYMLLFFHYTQISPYCFYGVIGDLHLQNEAYLIWAEYQHNAILYMFANAYF